MEACQRYQRVHVAFAPPCGTASRAREIQRKGLDLPQQLRSAEFLEGLPNLAGSDKTKVEKANLLYYFVVALMLKLPAGVTWSIENPADSHFGGHRHVQQFSQRRACKLVSLSQSAFGLRLPGSPANTLAVGECVPLNLQIAKHFL